MPIVCEKEQKGAGSVSFNIKDETESYCVLTVSRLLFFENISKPDEEAFYSEGNKWDTLRQELAKHGFIGGLGGFFIKEKIQITHENMLSLLSFTEAFIAECDNLGRDNSQFDYSGGDGLLLTIEEFVGRVEKRQVQITREILSFIEHKRLQQLKPFILLQYLCDSRGYKMQVY